MTGQETPEPTVSSIHTEIYHDWYGIVFWSDDGDEWVPYDNEYTRDEAIAMLAVKRKTYPHLQFRLAHFSSVETMIGEIE